MIHPYQVLHVLSQHSYPNFTVLCLYLQVRWELGGGEEESIKYNNDFESLILKVIPFSYVWI